MPSRIPPSSDPVALPEGFSPDQLDIVTELYALLVRLRTPSTLPGTATTGATPAPSTSAPGAPGSAPTPAPGAGAGAGASGSAAGTNNSNAAGADEISLRDFPTSTDHLRAKLQEARAAVAALPDMSRTIEEQRVAADALEARIACQREVLGGLREAGTRFAERMRD
jgi:hypothetical protein